MTGCLRFKYVPGVDITEQLSVLLAPPESIEVSTKSQKKRRGRKPKTTELTASSNSEYCDFCDTAGDLICCEECPSSFHLTCHYPPVRDSDLLRQKWKCNRCALRNGANSVSQKASSKKSDTSTFGPSFQKTPCSDLVGREAAMFLNDAAARSAAHRYSVLSLQKISPESCDTQSTKAEKEAPPDSEPLRLTVPTLEAGNDPQTADESAGCILSNDDVRCTFGTLAAAASAVNAMEFELPPHLKHNFIFPGDEDQRWKVKYQSANGAIDPDVPSTSAAFEKRCFRCSRTSQFAVLIPCDFCPLVFHGECVDPPLITFPRYKWMCPCHPEHVVDSKFLTSCSVSERMEKWKSLAAATVDPIAVQLAFLRKARHPFPPFQRRRWHWNGRLRTVIPDAVKFCYEHPVDATAVTPDELEAKRVITANIEWVEALRKFHEDAFVDRLAGQLMQRMTNELHNAAVSVSKNGKFHRRRALKRRASEHTAEDVTHSAPSSPMSHRPNGTLHSLSDNAKRHKRPRLDPIEPVASGVRQGNNGIVVFEDTENKGRVEETVKNLLGPCSGQLEAGILEMATSVKDSLRDQFLLAKCSDYSLSTTQRMSPRDSPVAVMLLHKSTGIKLTVRLWDPLILGSQGAGQASDITYVDLTEWAPHLQCQGVHPFHARLGVDKTARSVHVEPVSGALAVDGVTYKPKEARSSKMLPSVDQEIVAFLATINQASNGHAAPEKPHSCRCIPFTEGLASQLAILPPAFEGSAQLNQRSLVSVGCHCFEVQILN